MGWGSPFLNPSIPRGGGQSTPPLRFFYSRINCALRYTPFSQTFPRILFSQLFFEKKNSPVTPWGPRGAIFKSKFDPNFQFWHSYIKKTVKMSTIFISEISSPEHVYWWVVTRLCWFIALLYLMGAPNDPQITKIVIFGLFLTISTPLHMLYIYLYYCFWKNSSIRSFWAITQPSSLFWGVTVTIFVDFLEISPKKGQILTNFA